MIPLLEPRPPQLTICVLGGTGFVGTELITHLAKDGHWIRVPTRSTAGKDGLRVLDTVRLIRSDVHDPRALARLFAGVDVVINLIGILNEHGRSTFKSVHVDLAEKVISAARTAKVTRLLHMSSLAADPTTAPSKYLRSKGEAEAKVRASAPEVCSTRGLQEPPVGEYCLTTPVQALDVCSTSLPKASSSA